MKTKRIQFLEKVLRTMASAVLKKYKPVVVGITGSVGKTSTKEAVFVVLCHKFKVRKNEKNYNNEIGIPLTILGVTTGGRSAWKWLKIFFKWIFLLLFPVRYPEILVLEMGVDRPGDMDYLLSFVRPDIGIALNISSSHLEFFNSLDHIGSEKGKLIESLPENGLAVLNGDDERVFSMKMRTKAKVFTFGMTEGNRLVADNADYNYYGRNLEGVSFKINYDGNSMPVRLRHIVARHQIYSVLAAAAVGIHFKINMVDLATSLENFFSPAGRMNLIRGIRNSYIIDDSYNSSPASTIAALDVLEEIKMGRKIVVLGDMLELGKDETGGHQRVARKIFDIGADQFYAVGEKMEIAVKELRKMGFPFENIFYFDDPVVAGKKLKEQIRPGDLVLVKGSQSMRMEKVIEEVMAEPNRADILLCRQTPEWKEKPFAPFAQNDD